MSIKIFYDDVGYRHRSWRRAVKLFKKVIGDEGKVPGDLSFIIANDESLRNINIEFLKHNYYTDVITFADNACNVIGGEIYISIDTVKRNAEDYHVSLNNEILRVMVHGVLHLCGYDDKTSQERSEMRSLEDRWLAEYERENNEI